VLLDALYHHCGKGQPGSSGIAAAAHGMAIIRGGVFTAIITLHLFS
jgi:hypothetical protein